MRSFFQKAAADPTRVALVALRRGRNPKISIAPERVNFGEAERGETTSGVSPAFFAKKTGKENPTFFAKKVGKENLNLAERSRVRTEDSFLFGGSKPPPYDVVWECSRVIMRDLVRFR